MPVIIPKEKEDLWLNPELQDPGKLLDLLKPYPAISWKCMQYQQRSTHLHIIFLR